MRALASLAVGLVFSGAMTGPAAQAADSPAPAGAERVVAGFVDGVARCTIRADGAPLQAVLEPLARDLRFTILGLDASARSLPVTVDLSDRRLGQALEYVLGSVGLAADLRDGILAIRPAEPDDRGAARYHELALAAYARAQARFPSHPLGAPARLAQGGIEARRGNPGAALAHYEALIDGHPTSEFVGRATLRAAAALEAMDLPGRAGLLYRRLADVEDETSAAAWLGMARTANASDDHERALAVLAALDRRFPSPAGAEQRARLVEQVRARLGEHEPMAALHALETIEALGPDPEERRLAFTLRARAFEGLGRLSDASRSWLVHATLSEGSERRDSLSIAARLAGEAGDDLGVLVLGLEAERLGEADLFSGAVEAARDRLGLGPVAGPEESASAEEAPAERLARAEASIQAGLVDEASELIEALFVDRDSLDESATARVFRVRALVLDHGGDLEPAVALLSRARHYLETPTARARLDATAAQLLESHEFQERAHLARGGKY